MTIYKGNENYCKRKAKELREKFPYRKHFYALRRRCVNPKDSAYKYYGGRGIKCFITMEEISSLWFRDKAHNMKKPSIDRIDNDGNYTVENCRFIEHSLNCAKSNKEHKKIKLYQYDKSNNLIKIWGSIKKATEVYGTCIRGVLYKGRKTSKGYIWKRN